MDGQLMTRTYVQIGGYVSAGMDRTLALSATGTTTCLHVYALAAGPQTHAHAAERASGRASHGRLAPRVSLDWQLSSRPLVTSIG